LVGEKDGEFQSLKLSNAQHKKNGVGHTGFFYLLLHNTVFQKTATTCASNLYAVVRNRDGCIQLTPARVKWRTLVTAE